MNYPILILGATSSIGKSINQLLKEEGRETITVGRSKQNDICYDINNKFKDKISTNISGLVNCIGLNKSSFSNLEEGKRDAKIIYCNLIQVLNFYYSIEKNFSANSSIVHIGSLANKLLYKDDVAYMISKSGLSGLSRAISARLSKINGRSNILNPGYIKTPMTEASYKDPFMRLERSKRTLRNDWGEVEDVAYAVSFLLSSKSRFINCQEINLDDGWTVNSGL